MKDIFTHILAIGLILNPVGIVLFISRIASTQEAPELVYGDFLDFVGHLLDDQLDEPTRDEM